jgi:hypothetical protein
MLGLLESLRLILNGVIVVVFLSLNHHIVVTVALPRADGPHALLGCSAPARSMVRSERLFATTIYGYNHITCVA